MILLSIVTALLTAESALANTLSLPIYQSKRDDSEIDEWAHAQGIKQRAKYGHPLLLDRQSNLSERSIIALTNQNIDAAYYATIGVGQPQQAFQVILDTGSSALWLISQELAQAENGQFGSGYDTSASTSFKNKTDSFSVTYGSGKAYGYDASDDVQLGTYSLSSSPLAVVDQVTSTLIASPVSGIMGLAWSSLSQDVGTPFWQQLVQNNQISAENTMSFYLTRMRSNSQAQSLEPGGTFTLGEIDSSLYTGDISYHDIIGEDWWRVKMTGIKVNGETVFTPTMTIGAGVDSGTTLIGGPHDDIAKIWDAVEGAQEGSGSYAGYWFYPCDANPNIEIEIDGTTYAVNPEDLKFNRASSGSDTSLEWVLGDTFMKNYYTVFRHTPASVGFAQLSDQAVASQTKVGSIPSPTVGEADSFGGSDARPNYTDSELNDEFNSPVHCPSQSPSLPNADIEFTTPEGSIERWSESVTYPTVSYDDFGEPGVDKRYETFPPFYEFLKKSFPLLHSTLSHETVNKYGNFYEWKGSDSNLKPLILMAHNDVVPVPSDSLDRWDYPPFSGVIDKDGWVHGRGVGDCKNLLLSIYEVVESLIKDGFEPRRTIILSFGFDEEISGPEGAKYLSEHILNKYGEDSALAILDEGDVLDLESYDKPFALPAVKEKGYFDVKISVATAGGHSSVPKSHTSIGYLSKLIGRIEDHPHKPHLAYENPFTTHLQCIVQHSPDSLDEGLLKDLRDVRKWQDAADRIAERDLKERYLIQTSQAVDLIQGGVKVNALPELATAVVNQRIDVAGSVNEMKNHITELLKPYVENELNLNWIGFDNKSAPNDESNGSVKVETFGSPLDPAPNTPTSGKIWDTLVGTLKNVFGDELIVSPHLMNGNTDTRHYWKLTNNIYRFEAFDESLSRDIHTVNERVHKDAHIQSMTFLHQFIQQIDKVEA
ncbi:carboxypeptidase S [Wallemia mellicola]|nr:carboxypeptidase S [Wallemia mellicola]